MNGTEQMNEIDPRELRRALARFATGVAVVTATTPADRPVGLTVNSFASVSLDPPMVLWSLARRSAQLPAFLEATHFAINILGAEQRPLSERFASRSEDRFAGLEWERGRSGVPLLAGCLAVLECRRADAIGAGDHVVFLGAVESFRYGAGAPLLFFASRYGLEGASAA